MHNALCSACKIFYWVLIEFEIFQFIEKLRDIWVPPNEEQFLDTSYVVIGPIPREKDFHLTSRKYYVHTL